MKVYEVLSKVTDIKNIIDHIKHNEDVCMDDVVDLLGEYHDSLLTMTVKEV